MRQNPQPARAVCYRCHKAASTCVCASIARIENRTPLFIVQHPREQRHPMGSLRFARLGLERCQIAVAKRGSHGGLRSDLDFPRGAALLYPDSDARELDTLGPGERPSSLVLLDGTWSTVRPLLAGDPRLRDLPRVRITPRIAGRYRIRREPRAECESTLGALVEALRVLEPERNDAWDALMHAFDQMIDHQIEIVQTRRCPRRRKACTRRSRHAIPQELGLDGGPMVVVHLESTQANRMGEAGTGQRRQTVRLCATRLTTENAPRHFDEIVAVEGDLPSDRKLRFMGLQPGQLQRGCSPAELGDRWRSFVQPGDRLCAWNQRALDLLPPPSSHGPDRARGFVLKGIYATSQRRRAGDLQAACVREGLDLTFGGPRGLVRLAATVAMHHWLAGQRAG